MRTSLHPTLVNGRSGELANFASGGVEFLMCDTREVRATRATIARDGKAAGHR